MAEEDPELGNKYKNRSIAEQNSVDVAWELLMAPEFKDLQQCIFTNVFELNRFRQVIVNVVLATDIFEKEAKAMRNKRWEKAFRTMESTEDSTEFALESSKLKATIVIEHIIQASDVAHTMQHWHVYTKWNEMLFREMKLAFDQGRSANDPANGWYKGEIWFFDNYVCPLAKKLADCKVFGVSSDEFLNFAQNNRSEWVEKGEQIVQEMEKRYQKRKEMEIGGLTNDEINSFSAKDLEKIIKKLIEKGRRYQRASVDPTKSRNAAIQAWMDALEIYERAPAASEIRDRSIIFLVYSGIYTWLKGCNVNIDGDGIFVQNLARKFIRESKLYHRNPIHYFRAVSMLCEVTAATGNYSTALKLLEQLMSAYVPEKHSRGLGKVYGVDRAAVAFAYAAIWHDQMGNTEAALAACDYVIDILLPKMDPTNTLGMFELLTPLFRVLKPHGQSKRCFDLFNDHVHMAFLMSHGPDAYTPTKSLHEPMLWLYAMSHDVDGFDQFEKVVGFLVEGDNGIPDPFVDTIITRSTVGPSSMMAELCLLTAKRLERENRDLNLQKTIIAKGLKLARIADKLIKDKNGKVLLPIANGVHEPVIRELEESAKKIGVNLEDSQLTEDSLGLAINFPPSYLVTPMNAEEFLL